MQEEEYKTEAAMVWDAVKMSHLAIRLARPIQSYFHSRITFPGCSGHPAPVMVVGDEIGAPRVDDFAILEIADGCAFNATYLNGVPLWFTQHHHDELIRLKPQENAVDRLIITTDISRYSQGARGLSVRNDPAPPLFDQFIYAALDALPVASRDRLLPAHWIGDFLRMLQLHQRTPTARYFMDRFDDAHDIKVAASHLVREHVRGQFTADMIRDDPFHARVFDEKNKLVPMPGLLDVSAPFLSWITAHFRRADDDDNDTPQRISLDLGDMHEHIRNHLLRQPISRLVVPADGAGGGGGAAAFQGYLRALVSLCQFFKQYAGRLLTATGNDIFTRSLNRLQVFITCAFCRG